MQSLTKSGTDLTCVNKRRIKMAYLVLSNLILILVPLALKFVRSFSRYPDRLDFLFSVLTLAIILVGFCPNMSVA